MVQYTQRVMSPDGLTKNQLVYRILNDAHLYVPRKNQQEEKARQATVRFVRKEIAKEVQNSDVDFSKVGGLSFAVVCYFAGYLAASIKYKTISSKN